MPIYNVMVQYEFIMEAKNERDAELRAPDVIRDLDFMEEPELVAANEVVKRRLVPGGKRDYWLPRGYDMSSLPWGGNGEKTIGQHLGEKDE